MITGNAELCGYTFPVFVDSTGTTFIGVTALKAIFPNSQNFPPEAVVPTKILETEDVVETVNSTTFVDALFKITEDRQSPDYDLARLFLQTLVSKGLG